MLNSLTRLILKDSVIVGSCLSRRCKLKHSQRRTFARSTVIYNKDDEASKNIIRFDSFENAQRKNKETYLDMIKIFENRDVHRRGHVEFIKTALKHMEEFDVHKDLETYKTLIDVLPKGKFIPQNIFQAEFMHYPKQQQCAIDLLEQMEENGVMPDIEMESILMNIFGDKGHPLRKYWRMMYWMPRFKNISPWPIPNPPPNDALELAKLALERMSSVDLQSVVKVYQADEVTDSIDKTWIASVQSPLQKRLLDSRPKSLPVYIEGPFRIWLRLASVDYFIMRGEPIPKPEREKIDPDDVGSLQIRLYSPPEDISMTDTVHEQDDGVIYAMCATGTSSHDSLLSWVRSLETDGNPVLATVPVVFLLKLASREIATVKENDGSVTSPAET